MKTRIKKEIIAFFGNIQKSSDISFHTPLLGLCRSILAFATFTTLVFNDHATLFPIPDNANSASAYADFALGKLSLFVILSDQFVLAKTISVSLLLLVISGWRPKITGIIHWWIAFSLFTGSPSVDGGDQLSQILTLLLIPICLTDPRKWHWNKLDKNDIAFSPQKKFILFTFYVAIKLQVCFVYFQAATHKFNVTEWKDGTAVYYWFNNPYFGFNDNLRWISDVLFYSYTTTVIVTWGTLILELLLFMALLAKEKYKRVLFFFGLFFHFAIWIVHGLFSFFLVMTAALTLYLVPLQKNIPFSKEKLFR